MSQTYKTYQTENIHSLYTAKDFDIKSAIALEKQLRIKVFK